MAPRHLATSVAILIILVVECRAQESATPDPLTANPQSIPTDVKIDARADDKADAKNPPNGTSRSLGDKKKTSPSDSEQKLKTERATFGAGCFWHVEAVFEHLKGVNWAVSGYAGGGIAYPTYEMVHEGTTGHAEVVMVDFDPEVITYDDLLKVFWKNHDPTSINRQGEDEGPQYRSVIFYHNQAQRLAALKSYQELTDKRVYRSPIVTQLMPMRAFYRAEEYHQNYYGGKPRVSTRRKPTASKVKKSVVAKGKTAPAATKPANADPLAAAPATTAGSNAEQGDTP